MSIEFNEIPDWVCWIAQDADGIYWGYQVEPNLSHKSWYENEVGKSVNLAKRSITLDWKTTLKRINNK